MSAKELFRARLISLIRKKEEKIAKKTKPATLKTIKYIIFLSLPILFLSCSKVPLQKQNIENDSALVYVYVEQDDGINDTSRNSNYKIVINGIKTLGTLSYGEYKYYRLRPEKLTINAYRADIEEQSITLELNASKTYFLCIKSFSDDFARFNISSVSPKVGYEALKDTSLAGEYKKTELKISKYLIDETPEAKETKPESSKSKTDELMNAAKLKEQGLLTNEEFNTLKAEILNR